MNITVNDKACTVSDNCTLAQLLGELSLSDKGIAIAVNAAIISRSRWPETLLSEADRVTLIKATAGG